MKRIPAILAIILAFALSLSLSACSASGNKLVMGTSSGFEPFEMVDADKNLVGIDIDIAKAVAKEAGKELSIEDMAFDGLIAALQSGKIDFIAAGVTVNEERKKNVDFSEPYFDASQVVIVREGSDIKTPADLKNRKIAVQQGTVGDELASEVEGATIERLVKPFETITALTQSKVDAVVIDSFPAKIFVAKNAGLVILEEPMSVEQYAIAVKKGDTKLLATVNKVIAAMKADGSLDAIIKKYEDALTGGN